MYINVDTNVNVPVNVVALTDDTDFKTRKESVAYDAPGMDLVWNFVTTTGVQTQTAVIPTTGGGAHDWANKTNGIYAISIPGTSGGGEDITNNAEGMGWFSGVADGVLSWTGPIMTFRPATLNNSLINGTALQPVNVTALAANVITAASISAGALNGKGDWSTSTALATMQGNVTDILEDTGTTIPGMLMDISGNIDTIGVNVDAILSSTNDLVANQGNWLTADLTDVLARLPAELVSGRINASIGAIPAATLALFATTDTTESAVVSGSVAQLSRYVLGAGVVISYTLDGTVYCSQSDIEQIYGSNNVEKWADMDNDADSDKITARINRAITVATNDMNDMLRGGRYVLPITDTTAAVTVVELCATLAGVWLYESRGVEDFDPDTGRAVHKLVYMRDRATKKLQAIRANRIRIDAAVSNIKGTAVPKAV